MVEKVHILWVENAAWPQGWGIRSHAHDYYHLFYFLSGESTFIVDKQKYTACKGACFIVPPNITHELLKTIGEDVTAYEIKFLLQDRFSVDNLLQGGVAYTGNAFLEKLIAFVVDNALSRLPDYIDATQAAVYTIITYLTRQLSDETARSRNSRLIDTTGFSDVTVSIMVYIEENYTRQISLESIAGSIGYNKNYICYVFKKDTGITIIDYLNFVRIRQAAVYFSYSDMEISLTSSRVGFVSVSHFNRTFKKLTGISPSAYKKMHPLDIDGSLRTPENVPKTLEKQMPTIADAFGLFHMSPHEEEAVLQNTGIAGKGAEEGATK